MIPRVPPERASPTLTKANPIVAEGSILKVYKNATDTLNIARVWYGGLLLGAETDVTEVKGSSLLLTGATEVALTAPTLTLGGSGSSVVSMNNNKLTAVAAGTLATDAVNKGQVDTAIATAIAAIPTPVVSKVSTLRAFGPLSAPTTTNFSVVDSLEAYQVITSVMLKTTQAFASTGATNLIARIKVGSQVVTSDFDLLAAVSGGNYQLTACLAAAADITAAADVTVELVSDVALNNMTAGTLQITLVKQNMA